jgi:hypothetical protein
MRWAEFEQQQPRLAAHGHRHLIKPGVVLVGTIRRDGSPRLSAVEPFIMEGELWLSMLWQSTKARDLLRDPRILVHSIVTSRDGSAGEFKLRGKARPEADGDLQQRYAAAVAESLGWKPEPGRFHLFGIDMIDAVLIKYDDTTGDQYVFAWPPAREFVRRGTSPTSLGPPEPVNERIASG